MDEEKKLKLIFETVHVDYAWIKEHSDENLLGKNVKMQARDLLIVYFMLEEFFKIRIPEKTIVNGEFVTYRQIAGLVHLNN